MFTGYMRRGVHTCQIVRSVICGYREKTDVSVLYEEEDTCMSYEEEDTYLRQAEDRCVRVI